MLSHNEELCSQPARQLKMSIEVPRRVRSWRQVALEISIEYDSVKLNSLIYELLEAIEQQLLDENEQDRTPPSKCWIN